MLFNGSGISIFRRSDQNRSRVCFKSLCPRQGRNQRRGALSLRSEEHTSNSSHGYISYAGFCLKKKKRDLRWRDWGMAGRHGGGGGCCTAGARGGQPQATPGRPVAPSGHLPALVASPASSRTAHV